MPNEPIRVQIGDIVREATSEEIAFIEAIREGHQSLPDSVPAHDQ